MIDWNKVKSIVAREGGVEVVEEQGDGTLGAVDPNKKILLQNIRVLRKDGSLIAHEPDYKCSDVNSAGCYAPYSNAQIRMMDLWNKHKMMNHGAFAICAKYTQQNITYPFSSPSPEVHWVEGSICVINGQLMPDAEYTPTGAEFEGSGAQYLPNMPSVAPHRVACPPGQAWDGQKCAPVSSAPHFVSPFGYSHRLSGAPDWDNVKSIVAREGGVEVVEGDGTVGQTMTIPKFMPAVQSRMVNLHLDQHHVGSVTHEAARYLQTATHRAPSRVSWTDATAIEGKR